MLDAISRGLTIVEAAAEAGIGRRTLYEWKAEDEGFRRDLEEAYADGADVYEAEARRRAFAESDALLIFLLKCRDPEKFNQKQQVSLSGDPDAPPIGIAAQAQPAGRTIISPDNHRDPIPEHMRPPPGFVPPPRGRRGCRGTGDG